MDVDSSPDLASLRLVVHVADTGSLVAAGRELGISASAVGKALARLEEKLDARLFHRSTRSLAPSEEGVMVLGRARAILAETAALRDDLAERRRAPRGRIRLSLPLVAEPFLGALAAFLKTYDDVQLDLDFSDHQVDVVADGYDAAIRSGAVRDTRLIATRLGRFRMQLAAAPSYLEAHGTPRTEEELLKHRCVLFRYAFDGRLGDWPIHPDLNRQLRPTVVSNNLEARVAITAAGVGVGLLPDFAIRRHVRDGSLVPILPEVGQSVDLTMIRPSHRHEPPKMKALAKFMRERLSPVLDGIES